MISYLINRTPIYLQMEFWMR